MYLSPLIFHTGETSMLRKIGLTLLCATASLSTGLYAATSHVLKAGVTVEYDLPPNQPQEFINYMYWEVSANCKITTQDASNDLVAIAKAKKGKVNDIPLSKGDSLRLTVHNGDVIKLSAESGAKVEITNEGKHTIKATCST